MLDLRFLVGSGKAIHHQFCRHVIAAEKDGRRTYERFCCQRCGLDLLATPGAAVYSVRRELHASLECARANAYDHVVKVTGCKACATVGLSREEHPELFPAARKP